MMLSLSRRNFVSLAACMWMVAGSFALHTSPFVTSRTATPRNMGLRNFITSKILRRPGVQSTVTDGIVTFTTSMGTFKAKLFMDKMPITCGNFIDLANSGFYDDIHFHRVIPGFMNQFGCPNAKNPTSLKSGTGGPKGWSKFKACDGKTYRRNRGGSIPDEVGEPNQRISNEPGTLSMANTGAPETGGSQFFINVSHNKFLDWFDRSSSSAHPVFGKVTDGYDLVEKISQVPTLNDNPIDPIKMISVRVE